MNKTTYEQHMDARLPMKGAKMSRSEALATRLEAGAWGGRKIGVVVHHVASVYPVDTTETLSKFL
jgi:hypothetical protein